MDGTHRSCGDLCPPRRTHPLQFDSSHCGWVKFHLLFDMENCFRTHYLRLSSLHDLVMASFDFSHPLNGFPKVLGTVSPCFRRPFRTAATTSLSFPPPRPMTTIILHSLKTSVFLEFSTNFMARIRNSVKQPLIAATSFPSRSCPSKRCILKQRRQKRNKNDFEKIKQAIKFFPLEIKKQPLNKFCQKMKQLFGRDTFEQAIIKQASKN